jgi:hypothetical protein
MNDKMIKELATIQLVEIVYGVILKINHQSELQITKEQVEEAVRDELQRKTS